jgi:Cbb3-type cytochrome oxidase, cytochrome c subunit
MSSNRHEIVEKNTGLLAILIIVAISFGALVEITPLIYQDQTTEPVDNLRPYSALELEGRDIYIREGCNVCHSQMVRPSVLKLNVTAIMASPVKVSGNTPFFGGPSAQGLTYHVLGIGIRMNGIAFT